MAQCHPLRKSKKIFIITFFKALLHGLGWLLFVGFLLLVWGFLAQWIIGQGAMLAHSQEWLQHEKVVISNTLRKPLIIQSVQTFFTQPSLNSWQNFSDTNDLAKWYPLKNTKKTEPLKNGLKRYRQYLQTSKQIFLNLLQLEILRLMVVLLFLPLFGLLGFVGLIDGLAQRHLRKLQGARESSVLYQRAKECLMPSLAGAGLLYVGLPTCLNSTLLFLLFALLFSFTLAIAARTYKKYL